MSEPASPDPSACVSCGEFAAVYCPLEERFYCQRCHDAHHPRGPRRFAKMDCPPHVEAGTSTEGRMCCSHGRDAPCHRADRGAA